MSKTNDTSKLGPATQVRELRDDELENVSGGAIYLKYGDLIVARGELDAVRDDLYVLACAVDDVRRDLAAKGRRTDRELRDALDWLLEAATPLRDREIGTPA